MSDIKTVFGYDPGGDGKHGVAKVGIRDNRIVSLSAETLSTAEAVLRQLLECDALVGMGVDTLTCWSTGAGGWRPADRWLRDHYPQVRRSVVSPNGLYGSMATNGMSVLCAVRTKHPDVFITETHPKVLFWRLAGRKYNFQRNRAAMTRLLEACTKMSLDVDNDHEWDAAISAYAATRYLFGEWSKDLHALPSESDSRLIAPCGPTCFVWPDESVRISL